MNPRSTKREEQLDSLARTVIGAALEVHRQLGPGFQESVYEEALGIELKLRDVYFARQVLVPVQYKGFDVGRGKLDVLVEEQLVLELKSVDALASVHVAQLLAYLKATSLTLGLLINFNVPRLKDGIRRIIRTR